LQKITRNAAVNQRHLLTLRKSPGAAYHAHHAAGGQFLTPAWQSTLPPEHWVWHVRLQKNNGNAALVGAGQIPGDFYGLITG